MKILMISEGYPPDEGGVATSAQRIARHLAAAGAEVAVYTFDRDNRTDFAAPIYREDDGGLAVFRLGPFVSPIERQDLSDRQVASLRRRIVDTLLESLAASDFPPDIVFSLYLIESGFLATFVAGRLAVPHVAGVRGNDIGRNVYDLSLLPGTAFVIEHATRIICVNSYLSGVLQAAFPQAAGKTCVIRNSIARPPEYPEYDAAEERRTILERSRWPEDALLLCSVSAFREQKGIFEALAAFADLAGRHRRARLVVLGNAIGSTEYRLAAPLIERLEAQGLIHFHGRLARDAARKIMAGCDAILQPSHHDGMANAVLEAMAVGLCPVVSQVFADIVEDGVNGIVLDKVTPVHIVAALERLEDAPGLAPALGDAAYRASLTMRPDLEARAYLKTFREALAQSTEPESALTRNATGP